MVPRMRARRQSIFSNALSFCRSAIAAFGPLAIEAIRYATAGGGTHTTANNGTFAAEINNNSQIVGMYTDASNHGHGFLEITVPNSPPSAGTRERNSDGTKLLPPSAYLVLNFRDAAPPSPRGVLPNATPRRFPLRLITRNLSSGI